jgi:NDP-sugar pyrophosphorylase family protein
MPSCTKAVILAAGRGTRMGALTEDLPKPMLPIAGRPMLEHIVHRLQQAALSQILIVVGYRRELIEEHFRAGFEGISFAVQENAEGTAKALLLAREFAGPDGFLLTYGDIICGSANYTGIFDVLRPHLAEAVEGVKNVD